MRKFSITEINTVADFCVNNLNLRPGLFGLNAYLVRLQAGEPLDAPIVSDEEHLALHILDVIGRDKLDASSQL